MQPNMPTYEPKTLAALKQLADLAEGFDRSWSFSVDGVEERALFFLPASRDALEALVFAANALGFDAAGVDEYRTALPGADAIGLTVSRNGSLRLYAQYWQQLAAQVSRGDLTPAPLYLGIKRYAGGGARRDTYFCLPLAPESEYRPELEMGLAAFGAQPRAVKRLLDALTPETCIWTRTQGVGRSSWLATVRRANLAAEDVIEALAPVANRVGVPSVIDALGQGDLLHIAGGDDSIKGRFLTFYVETDRAGMTDFLNGMSF